ncbi:hypothetical protein ABN056_00925 [Providencia vermicola]|uniref:hypothetical protein n=1 Tax=Morganellaceae TaxID=1903414 RepID=UPI0030762315
MNEKKDLIINIGMPVPAVLGTRMVEKYKNGNVVDARTGSFTYKFVPQFIVVLEDDLAKKVVDVIASDFLSLNRKYLLSGTWGNQASCLLGFLMYAEQLQESNVPPLSIMSIDDGDISEESRQNRINNALRGNVTGKELKTAQQRLNDQMFSFNLEFKECKECSNKQNHKKCSKCQELNVGGGWPEYNHKRWFEEIDKETILSIGLHTNCDSKYYNDLQIESFLDLIEYSKSIVLDDYHEYYNQLKEWPVKTTLDGFQWPEHFVLSSIKRFNHKKWSYYTDHIKEALTAMDKINTQNFVSSDIFFER